jgi:hypothetical protein
MADSANDGHAKAPAFVIALWIAIVVALVIYTVKMLARTSWR